MKSTFAVLLVVLLSIGIVQGQQQEQQKHDGFWWTTNTNEAFKVGFVSGYVQAIDRAYERTIFLCLGESMQNKWTDKEVADCVRPVAGFNFTNIAFGQLQEGVDEFYKDFRNKNIHINVAMDYVRDQLRGDKSSDQLEKELNERRRIANK